MSTAQTSQRPDDPKYAPLRADVKTLGSLLGEVLVEQGGQALFERVESARVLARARRNAVTHAETELVDVLSGLSPHDAQEVVRAFSAYFGLVNMAERVHRIRRRRSYLQADEQGQQPGSFVAVLQALKDEGVDAKAIQAALNAMHVEPVFTAHPTEATRRSLLIKQQRIARALVERFHSDILPLEEARGIARIRNEVTTSWQTDEHLAVQPTVADEVEHVLFYINDVIYRIVPAIYENLRHALDKVYGKDHGVTLPRTMIQFASWVGGDMDGNPNVGAHTIRQTLMRQRDLIVRRYISEIKELHDYLSQSRARATFDKAVDERIEAYRHVLPSTFASIPERYRDMPYRVLLTLMSTRLQSLLQSSQAAYQGVDEFVADLNLIAHSLETNKGGSAGLFRVQRLMHRVSTFGFHLATLDVRQDALVHRRVVGRLLGNDKFPELPQAERLSMLQRALSEPHLAPWNTNATWAQAESGSVEREVFDTLNVISAIATCRAQLGNAAIGPHIISMAQGADDALALLYIAKAGGLTDASGNVPLDIAPLFETVPDLVNAQATMQSLLDDPLYRKHLATRDNQQIVMLGYSDSNKESGIIASRWALYQAQIVLIEAAAKQGVNLTLFHGRGGTVSRGGSKVRNAILADPQGAVRGRLRVTEQGEIIDAKYGLRDIAMRTLELMSGAVLQATLSTTHASERPEWHKALDSFAEHGRGTYRALVYQDKDFFQYFRDATPIDVIERLYIGSRPASRRAKQGIENLRAIPWVFAWTQNRQIITGWYGVGSALARIIDTQGVQAVRDMAQQWLFFANLLADTEMVLAKADMLIGSHYAALAGTTGERIFPLLLREFELTRETLNAVRHADGSSAASHPLLEGEPSLQRAIHLRNPYVDPMSLLQVDLLKRWRATDRQDGELLQALFTCVKGIARGMQNTG